MFAPHVDDETLQAAITTSPAAAGIPPEVVRRAARSSINWHRATVTSLSFAAGLPGGLVLAATIPADLAQYFAQVLILVQKLAYLYGWPSLMDDDKRLDDETRLYVTLFVGVAMGSEVANAAIGKVAQEFAKQVAHRLPREALTKYAIYNLIKQVGKWIGVRITKDRFAKGLSKAVPLLGGALSGGLSWVTFSAMANRLDAHLAELPLADRAPEEE
ncbi:MAG: hypothetical protein EA397_17910 [Deltaproteobacteria bacterium]|nr:MAG: hypothetical protein EA397_17910 [Deltaproteobacteria bacterium]